MFKTTMRILFAWLSAVHIIIRGPWNRFGSLGGEANIVELNIYSKNSVLQTRWKVEIWRNSGYDVIGMLYHAKKEKKIFTSHYPLSI